MPNTPRAQRDAFQGLYKTRTNRVISVFYVDRATATFARHNVADETATRAAGWYWRFIDDNRPHGPFSSSQAAYRNANPKPRRQKRVHNVVK